MEKLISPPKRDIVSFAFTSPGLVLSTPGLVRNSRRLVKHTSRRVRLGRRSGIITLKMRQSVWWRLSLRARIYVFYFPKKVFTHSHNARFLLIYKGFECEGFDFKVFTWAAKHSPGRWTLVKGGKRKPSHRKTTRKSADKRGKNATAEVNTWKSKPSQSKPLKIRQKRALCEGVNAF